MRSRVSGRRPGRAHLATALLGPRLEPWVFPVVDELTEELTENAGLPPASPLFTVPVIEAAQNHSGYLLMRHMGHALSLARLATLLAPRLPSRTPREAQHALYMEGESYRLYADALLRCGRNFDAQRAADRARSFFRIPIVVKSHPQYEWILDLTAGQIVFHLDEMERGLEIVSRAADCLRHHYLDLRRFLVGRQLYGSLLMWAEQWDEALAAFDEVLDIAGETHGVELNDVELIHAVVYNVSVCGKRLRSEDADECNQMALELLEKSGISADIPRSGWTAILDLLQQGKTKTAISEMYKYRQGYIERGFELTAHLDVTPSIVNALVAEGRFSEAHKVGEHAIRKLSAAGLKFMASRVRRALEAAPPEGGAALKHGA